MGLDLLGPETVLLFAAASKTELVMQPSPVKRWCGRDESCVA